MSVLVRGEITGGQCGIGRLVDFKRPASDSERYYLDAGYTPIKDLAQKATLYRSFHKGGTGLFGSGFIDNEDCRVAYEELCRHYHLVFQTPVRLNKNSDNKFFYAMWDDKQNDDVEYIQGGWPF